MESIYMTFHLLKYNVALATNMIFAKAQDLIKFNSSPSQGFPPFFRGFLSLQERKHLHYATVGKCLYMYLYKFQF